MASIAMLVLDDDPATARVASGLRVRGYQVAVTTDPEEALRLANRLVPDIVVVNAANPNVKGVHLIRVLRTRSATALIPAIFLGDPKVFEEQIKGFRLSSDGFLSKPLNVRDFDLQVNRALRERERTETAIRPAPQVDKDFTISTHLTGMRGNLHEIGLPSVLTLLEMERKTGLLVLIVEPEGTKARLYLRKGHLMRAKMDLLDEPRNAELIYDLLGRTKGKFDFRPQPVEADDEISMLTANLLLEGARRLDEGRRPEEGNPTEDRGLL